MKERKARKTTRRTIQSDKASLRARVRKLQHSVAGWENHLQIVLERLEQRKEIDADKGWREIPAQGLRRWRDTPAYGHRR